MICKTKTFNGHSLGSKKAIVHSTVTTVNAQGERVRSIESKGYTTPSIPRYHVGIYTGERWSLCFRDFGRFFLKKVISE